MCQYVSLEKKWFLLKIWNALVTWYRYSDCCDVTCVFGSRFIKGSKLYDYPLIKLIVNRLANNFIRLLFLIKYKLLWCTYWCPHVELLNVTIVIVTL